MDDETARPAPPASAREPLLPNTGIINLPEALAEAKSLTDLLALCEFRNANGWPWMLGPEGAQHIIEAITAWNARTPPAEPGAGVVEALREVMDWIDNWSPSFTEDDEWPATRAKVKAALTPKERPDAE